MVKYSHVGSSIVNVKYDWVDIFEIFEMFMFGEFIKEFRGGYF
jgi:hypothetical protein